MTWYQDILDWMLSGDIVRNVWVTGLLILLVPFVIHWLIFKSPDWFRMQLRLRSERKKVRNLKNEFSDGEITEEEYHEKFEMLLDEMELEDSYVIVREEVRESSDRIQESHRSIEESRRSIEEPRRRLKKLEKEMGRRKIDDG